MISNCNDAFKTPKIKLFDELIEKVTSDECAIIISMADTRQDFKSISDELNNKILY